MISVILNLDEISILWSASTTVKSSFSGKSKELEADDQLLRGLRGSVELYQQFATEPKTRHSPFWL